MTNSNREDLAWKIAEIIHDHYQKNDFNKKLTLNDIQKKLGYMPGKLSELRNEAVSKYIEVEFKLNTPRDKELEKKLKLLFKHQGLKDAIVLNYKIVQAGSSSLAEALGKGAAMFFERKVKDRNAVVFSCGLTINSMINQINAKIQYEELRAISSIVLCIDTFEQISPAALIHNFTQRFLGTKGIAYQLPTNIKGKMETMVINKILKSAIFDEAMEANYFFLGIGSLAGPTTTGLSGGFNSLLKHLNCLDQLKDMQSCGEISYCPLVKPGCPKYPWLKDALEFYHDRGRIYFDHVYTLDFKEMINKKKDNNFNGHVVAVAGGPKKEWPVYVCLNMDNFIDTIISDSLTIQKVLEIKSQMP
jgi:DNA-binding transcriptional regulator LsrR (DeoR family)